MSEARTLWEEGHEPGHQVVALGVALVLTLVCLDVTVGPEQVGLFFDLTFVAVCVLVALLVRPTDFFAVGVLPPLMMLTAFVLLAVARPASIAAPQDGVVQAVVSGLSHHAVALGVGYALCLGCLAVRDQVLRTRVSRGSDSRRPHPPARPPGLPPTSR